MLSLIRKAVLFIGIFLLTHQQSMAQTNYETLWKSVSKLESEGKTKDALASVENIVLKSRKEKNTTQTVKGLLYKYRYMMTLEEESEVAIVKDLKREIEKSTGTDKAILQSILAELYWQYFDENTWKFSERTETDEKQSDDFRTWDLKTLFKEINSYYIASLENAALLQQTKLDNYKALLSEEKGSKVYRPTLYDLLAHRAIDYFNDDKSNLAEPSNAFSIDDKNYFADAATFIKLQLNDADKNSGEYNALKIYQELLAFKMSKRFTLDELADADLKRVQYVREHYFNKEENETLYLEALQRMRQAYAKCNVGATIHYETANHIYTQLEQKEDGFAYTVKDVLSICEQTIKNYPDTEGAKNCAALQERVFHKSLSFTTEETVIPNQPFKALVSFKNIKKIYLKVVPINYADKEKIFNLKNNETQKDVIKRLNAIRPHMVWNITLPVTEDYADHSAELKIDGIKNGFYAIVMSTNASFLINEGKEAVAVNTVFSSQLSYVTKSSNSRREYVELYVLDRKSGKPISGAEVKFYQRIYDYKTREYVRTDIGSKISDENGFVSHKVEKANSYNSGSFFFDIKYKTDFLASEQSYYHYFYPVDPKQEAQKSIHLFTDRSIYRPGQTIYFKGILTERNGEVHSILSKQPVKVVFRDVNYQEIKSQDFTTNEFGSFTGSFTAPVTGLMGSMTIVTDHGSANVQVEEYKRPKFEVTFDPVKKSYNLNDTVAVTGKAMSYAGANIDNAEVRYSVRRVAQFPVWCWWGWRHPWYPQSNEKIIATGTTKTDDNGSFTIDFTAIPDLSISKDFKPYFNYEITAEVIDINGETHDAVTTVRVGYLAIDANLNLADKLDYTKENKLTVTTNNLNGEPEPTDISIKIYKLEEPLNPKKKRLWSEPDLFVMSQAAHDKLFPYELYSNEDLMANWKRGSLVKSINFNTGKQTEADLAPNTFTAGAYILEFSCKDKNGNPIEFNKTFTADAATDQSPAPKAFAYFNVDKTTVKPGDSVTCTIGSSMEDAYAVIEIGFKGKLLKRKMITLSNELKRFSFSVKEEHTGGIEINYILVNKNRSYSGLQYISVPYEDRSLKIEWLTFRDKLLPGQKEQWKLKISGTNKEKVSSELLAGMYDASLDAFLPHSFSFGLSQSYYSGYLGSYGSDAFGLKNSSLYTAKGWNPTRDYAWHNYDALNLFGLRLGDYYRRYQKYMLTSSMSMKSKSESLEYDMASEGATGKAAMAPSAELEANEVQDAASEDFMMEPVPVKPKDKPVVTPRTNMNETAFFFPQLQTDEEGNILLNFEMPEALTRWNFLGLAHTKALKHQYFTKSIVTQKELMVTPNAPRFLREGDRIEFTVKITNLSDMNMDGTAELVLYDAVTMKEISFKLMETVAGAFKNTGERNFPWKKAKIQQQAGHLRFRKA
jgi:5-hydroxyisourate hydrolase-like protein (transthyretin family)